jgi:hypothetical protein
MDWDIRIEEDGTYMSITGSGKFLAADFLHHIESVLFHPSWQPGISLLCDFRELNISHITHEEIWQMVQTHRIHSDRLKELPSPIAVVVSSQLAYGLIRMWELYAHDLYPESAAFLDMEEALEWIYSARKKQNKNSE